MPVPQVSVVIPARNAEATLGATLAGLAAQVGVDFEAVVVDSASTDGTIAAAVRQAGGQRWFRGVVSNSGGEPAGSRNVGAGVTHAGAIAFIDADCVPDPGWLSAGLEALAGADLVQGRVLPAGPHRTTDRTLSVGHESGLYETANLFVRREIFERAGGFAPLPGRAPLPGSGPPGRTEDRPFGEDTWFAWKARRSGAVTAFSPHAVVRHAVFARGIRGYVAEQRRRARFPALVAAVPELRSAFLYRRWFLSRQTACFDLALAGVAVASLTRRRGLALAAALPYVTDLPRRPPDAAARIAGDAVGCAALLAASLRTRTPVL